MIRDLIEVIETKTAADEKINTFSKYFKQFGLMNLYYSLYILVINIFTFRM